jgi:choline dehydrogenase-like flavoprotein
MKKAIIIGSGAGGATVAKELQGKYNVTVIEAGKAFKPFSMNLSLIESLKKRRMLFDENLIPMIFPAMKTRKTKEKIVMVNGIGLGGTTTLSAGNAVRMDKDLKALGINLDNEFEEIYNEIPISTEHTSRWRKTTRQLYDICDKMGLNPKPLPKLVDFKKCMNCGRCILGCPEYAKWDSRRFLNMAIDKGAVLKSGDRVEKAVIKDSKATGVLVKNRFTSRFIPADLVVIAAGGFGTPAILESSGIACSKTLFVDPVLTFAAEYKDSFQHKELTMPFVVNKEKYIISPYFDYLSYFFNKDWKIPAKDTLGIMIKLADTATGFISKNKINKSLTDSDEDSYREGSEICKEIFQRLGVDENKIFMGTINAGHPGGMLPLTESEADTFHHKSLPDNMYVADSSLFPKPLGNPPILTIIAMAKRVSKIIIEKGL